MGKLINETGNRYGRLIVLEEAGRDKHGNIIWLCKCDCGNFTNVTGASLRNGDTKSCSCLKREKASQTLKMCRSIPKKLPKGEATFNIILQVMKRGAKSRHLKWSISDEKVKELISQPCYYCGASPRTHAPLVSRSRLNGDFPCNGLDRVDNQRGYEEDNVVPCCKDCNQAKGTMLLIEFQKYVDRLSKHFLKTT